MGYIERRKLYEKIEHNRGVPLITYVTSSRFNASGNMGSDVIPHFVKQIEAIKGKTESVDLLIVSQGGDAMVSWRIISLLRENFKKISVITPYEAFSAATLVALGADEILMHPFSNLGPVDPQITKEFPPEGNNPPKKISFGAEDLNHYFKFVKDNVGISDQQQLQEAFKALTDELEATAIGFAKRSSTLSLDLGEKLLKLHMKDITRVNGIIEALSQKYYHHGFALNRTDAKEIGLNVKYPDAELEQLIWEVWKDIEEEMQILAPFDIIEELYRLRQDSILFQPFPQVIIPQGLAPQLQQQVQQQVFQQLMQQIKIIPIEPIDYTWFLATLESLRCRNEYRVTGKIYANRNFDMSLKINQTQISAKWEELLLEGADNEN